MAPQCFGDFAEGDTRDTPKTLWHRERSITMKAKILFPLLVLALSATIALGASGSWMEDYEKALAKAKTENKLVLMDFTGSDWCGWCMKLDDEVFSKPAFKKYAKENLVLMEVDFPKGKHQTRKLKEQNGELSKKFGIRGYPTIIVLDSKGEKVGQLGYMEGGPDAFIAELEKLKKS